MVKRRYLWVGLFSLLSLFIVSGASQVYSHEDVIEGRRKLMKANGKAYTAIKKAMKIKDYATVEEKAKEIASDMDKLPELFPKGSTSEESRAKPVIWEKWDLFNRGRMAMKVAAEELAVSARAKDGQQVSSKFKTFSKSCGGCHKLFWAPKKKKKRN